MDFEQQLAKLITLALQSKVPPAFVLASLEMQKLGLFEKISASMKKQGENEEKPTEILRVGEMALKHLPKPPGQK